MLSSNSLDNNIPPGIASRVGTNLHLVRNHPLNIIKSSIESYLTSSLSNDPPSIVDSLSPVVTVQQCFDDLLIPPEHVSRSKSDTYYLSSTHCLRTHTSAHQSGLLAAGETSFLCTGDVYRRDEIDRTHYPVFHQMEGVRVFGEGVGKEEVEKDLKKTLEGLAAHLFGDCEMRWVDAYFPFTEPSAELEILYEGEWLEVLGCGVVQRAILDGAGVEGEGWAFGLGLERLAMVLFDIPDIRLFWSKDERFLSQFEEGKVTKFKPFSKYPPMRRDMAYWTNGKDFHPNDLAEIVRQECGSEDLVESVVLIDEFKKGERVSNCWRFTYRSMERSLTAEEVDDIQFRVRERVGEGMGVELR